MLQSCFGVDLLVTGILSDDEACIAYVIVHATTTAGSIIIKNGIDNTGDIIFKFITGVEEVSTFCSFNIPLKARLGVYVELTNVTATIGYFG